MREKGLFTVLRTLQTAFHGNNQELVKVFPNIRALRGVFDLLGPGLETNIALLDEMKDSTGVTDEAFNAVSDTLLHRWKRVSASFQMQLISIGELLRPTAVKILDFAETAIEAFAGLDDSTKEIVAKILSMGPAMIGIGFVAKGASIGLGVFSAAVGGITKAVGTLGAALGFSSGAGGGKRGLLNMFRRVALRAGPIGLIIGGVATVIMAAWTPLSTFFEGFWSVFTGGAEEGRKSAAIMGHAVEPTALDRLKAKWQEFVDALGPIGDAVKDIFDRIGAAWEWLQAQFQSDETQTGQSWANLLVEAAIRVLEAILAIMQGWDRMKAFISQKITSAWEWLKDFGEDPFGTIRELWDAFAGHIETIVPDAWAWMTQVAEDPFAWVRDKWNALLTWLRGFSVGNMLAETVPDVFAWIREQWDALTQWMLDKIPDAILWLFEQGSAIIDRANEILEPGFSPDHTAADDFGPSASLSPLPVAPASPFSGGPGERTISIEIGEGAVAINAPNADAREIHDIFGREMAGQVRSAVEEADSTVAA